jgi:hypothetical protein
MAIVEKKLLNMSMSSVISTLSGAISCFHSVSSFIFSLLIIYLSYDGNVPADWYVNICSSGESK